jgi:hypothetical protein
VSKSCRLLMVIGSSCAAWESLDAMIAVIAAGVQAGGGRWAVGGDQASRGRESAGGCFRSSGFPARDCLLRLECLEIAAAGLGGGFGSRDPRSREGAKVRRCEGAKAREAAKGSC